MKNRFYALPLKAGAVILVTLTALVTAVCSCLVGVMIYEGYYNDTAAARLQTVYREMLSNYNYQAYDLAVSTQRPDWADALSENYYYRITDDEGDLVAGNYGGQPVFVSEESLIVTAQGAEFTVFGAVAADADGAGDPFATAKRAVERLHELRFVFLAAAFGGLLLTVTLLIYLFCSVANHPNEEKPRLNPVDQFPLDAATVLLAGLAVMEIMALVNVREAAVGILALILCGVADFLLLLWYFLSLAARLKVGALRRTTLLGKFCGLIKRFAGWLARAFSGVHLAWKAGLAVAAVTVTELFFLVFTWQTEDLLIWWALEKILLVPLIVLVAVSLQKLRKGSARLAAGELDARIDTAVLPGDLRKFGDHLNSIGEGMNKAVEARMKSERFKTELITNVSHDIKTPLTSIINYVDLIQKEEPENEKVRQYLDVLVRQSARLKKLIEDLVEASKASTGNLPVHPEPCDLGVLLTQMAGEYHQRLCDAQLEPVLHLPEGQITVSADPRHIWRIMDNLMTNVVKYALGGTRVYLDLFVSQREAAILFRNISRSALNVSGEELQERFVRGDSSRNTEGSGLGLSIARSLTELQGGTLRVDVDGDLFKVLVNFPRIS